MAKKKKTSGKKSSGKAARAGVTAKLKGKYTSPKRKAGKTAVTKTSRGGR